jgi:hypothetical protein
VSRCRRLAEEANGVADHALNSNEQVHELETALADLAAKKDGCARTTIGERIAMLTEIKERLIEVTEAWAKTAARKKGIRTASPMF